MDDMAEMLDHYRITKLINDYCQGCDRADGDRMAGVYAGTSWDDHGIHKMSGHEFVAEIMKQRASRNDTMSHHIGQTQVSIDGDSAGAETYFLATVEVREDSGRVTLHHMGGRYVDDLVREPEGWRVKRRLTLRDWSFSHIVTSDYIGTLNFIPGRTDGGDPSYAALNRMHGAGACR